LKKLSATEKGAHLHSFSKLLLTPFPERSAYEKEHETLLKKIADGEAEVDI